MALVVLALVYYQCGVAWIGFRCDGQHTDICTMSASHPSTFGSLFFLEEFTWVILSILILSSKVGSQ